MGIRTLSLVAPLLIGACHASAQVNTTTKTAADEPEPAPSFDAGDSQRARTAHIGVVHTLSLTQQAAQTATCRCMAAAIGAPGDSAFQWRGAAPTVGDDAFVLAVSNDGTPCDKPVGGRGPSIQGVEETGGNVVVTIEEARNGIPLASGAIIRRPAGDGWLVFRAGRLPYDDAVAGSGDSVCRIKLRLGPTRADELDGHRVDAARRRGTRFRHRDRDTKGGSVLEDALDHALGEDLEEPAALLRPLLDDEGREAVVVEDVAKMISRREDRGGQRHVDGDEEILREVALGVGHAVPRAEANALEANPVLAADEAHRRSLLRHGFGRSAARVKKSGYAFSAKRSRTRRASATSSPPLNA